MEITRRIALARMGAGGSMLMLPALLAACGDDDPKSAAGVDRPAGSTAEIDLVNWGLLGSLLTLDSTTGGSADGWMTQALGLEGLVYLDAEFRLQPLLAESWEAPSPTEYVFKIREGVTYWDGSPLTPEDVVDTIQRHIDPKVASHMASYMSNVAGAEVSGTNEVVMRMKAPDPFILYIMPMIHIAPKAFAAKMGREIGTPAGAKQTTMGTGPYKFVSFTLEDGVVVERNEDYWGEKPRVLRATLKTVENAQTQLLAARSGEIDGIFGFDLQQSGQWDKLSNVKPYYTPGMRTIHICFNVEEAPFDDVNVRRAVVHASDRVGWVDAFLNGHAEPGSATLVAREQWTDALLSDDEVDAFYESLADFPFDLEAAKAALAQSAHPDGFSTTITYPSYELAAGKALVNLSENLKQIGIDLQVKEVTLTKWAADYDNHLNPGMYFLTGSAVYPDPMQFMTTRYSSSAATKGGTNMANYRNPEADALIKAQASATEEERLEIVQELFTIAAEDVPYMGMWYPNIALALNKKLVYEGFNCLYYTNRAFLANISAAA